MRVMVVSNIFPPHVRGGYELGILEVARAFAAAGHDVEVVTSRVVGMLNKTAPQHDVPVRAVLAPVTAYESDLSARLEGSALWVDRRTEAFGGVDVANVLALDEAIRRFRPERIWFGNPLGLGPVGILEAALSAAVPVVVHLMDEVDRYLAGYRRPIHWLGRVRRLKRQLTAVSCSSRIRQLNSLIGVYGRHEVVPNGFDIAAVPRHASPGRHDGPLRFVYAGQVEPTKGIPQLIEGIARLRDEPQLPPFTLDVIGPAAPSYVETLTAELQQRGLADTVRLLGRLEKAELLRRLADYDVATLLLRPDEPFAYAWLEAAAVGLPVVLARGHAVREFFPGSNPLFVDDRDDIDAVAQALRWCLTHRDALEQAGRALRDHLRLTCDAATVVNPKYLAVLESAAAPSRATDVETLVAATLTCDAVAMAHGGWGGR